MGQVTKQLKYSEEKEACQGKILQIQTLLALQKVYQQIRMAYALSEFKAFR